MKKLTLIVLLLLLALNAVPAAAQAPEGEEYIVQRGDWLVKIAEEYYGDGSAYAGIIEATNAKAAEDDSFSVIRNPNLILIGQKLWIPEQPAVSTRADTGASAVTATSAMPNAEDYPALESAQSIAQRLTSTIETECPTGAREFPLAEPDYTGKRASDLSPFETALADLTEDRLAELGDLVLGKSILDLQALLDAGELTSEELVTYYVDRIQRYDIDKLNSVMELNPEALDLARALDEERAAGTVRGPMHGIPVLLKDNIATGDQMHTTAGAAALRDWVPDRDAFLVGQIRDAGGIIMGKANLSEWANYMDPCMPSGFSVVGGQTRHPYGPFDPLGSSSGSAVSAAANLTTVSVGSETSGSLIQPANVNSVVAMRPSLGLISRDYVVPLGANLDTPGPMGRSVTDVAILLNAMAGVDPNDPKTSDAASLAGADFTQFLDPDRAKELKVGVVEFIPGLAEMKAQATEEELKTALGALPGFMTSPPDAIEALESQGIEVVRIPADEIPIGVDTAQVQLEYGFQADLNAFLAGLGQPAPVATIGDVVAFNEEDMANRAPYDDRLVKWSAETELTAQDQAQIVAEAQAYAQTWMTSILETYDIDVLIVGPLYASNAGAAGVPALTIPAGLDINGQPTGIIISGPYLSDPNLLGVGYALEQALQGRVEPDLDAVLESFEGLNLAVPTAE